MHLGDLASIASATAVLVALVMGVLTLRQWQRTRYLSAAAELVHTLLAPEFTRSIARIVQLPERCPPEKILADPEMVAAAFAVSHVFESLGVLVYHRLLPLSMVDHLVGGYVRTSWRRLGLYSDHRRKDVGTTFAEWFQWLAERLEQYPLPAKTLGAHVAFRDWKP